MMGCAEWMVGPDSVVSTAGAAAASDDGVQRRQRRWIDDDDDSEFDDEDTTTTSTTTRASAVKEADIVHLFARRLSLVTPPPQSDAAAAACLPCRPTTAVSTSTEVDIPPSLYVSLALEDLGAESGGHTCPVPLPPPSLSPFPSPFPFYPSPISLHPYSRLSFSPLIFPSSISLHSPPLRSASERCKLPSGAILSPSLTHARIKMISPLIKMLDQ